MALGLLLKHQACLERLQIWAQHIVWEIWPELGCAAMRAWEVLLQSFARVDEPEVLCAARHLLIPAKALHILSSYSCQP